MFAVMFPGQGSQRPGMGRETYDAFPAAREAFDTISEAIGASVADLCFESDEATLRRTENAQIALFAVGVAGARALRELGAPQPRFALGHSVGEYAALAGAGVLDISDAARLVRRRGDLMARSGALRPGAMSAILGLDADEVAALCGTTQGACVVANDNCPGQVVVSGEAVAVASVGEAAREAGAKRVVSLNVSGAFHSPLMREAADAMGEALEQARFHPSDVTVVSNVLAAQVEDPAAWPGLLARQLAEPVRWRESLLATAVPTFVELGCGDVLVGLLRRTRPEARGLSAVEPDGLRKAAVELAGVPA